VVVVDDGSAARLHDAIGSLRHQLNITLLRQPHSGPAMARNYGAAHAKGTYLAFTDDDCRPAADWLLSLSTSFGLFPEAVLGGHTINELVSNPYSTASQLLVDYLYTYWNPTTQQATFFASNNLALPAKYFQAVGGFDGGWDRAAGEDRDLCDRLVRHGFRLIYVPEALVHHAHVLNFWSFCRQHFNYGWGAYHFHRVRAKRAARRVRHEPLMFYLKSLAYPFTQSSGWTAVSLAMLLGLAQLANAIGSIAAGLSQLGRRFQSSPEL
jgi:GT2 family glycosyltransferase